MQKATGISRGLVQCVGVIQAAIASRSGGWASLNT